MSAAVRNALVSLAAVAGLVTLLLVMQGVIGGHRTAPGTVPIPAEVAPPGRFVPVERRLVPEHREWAGTVRARTSALVASRVLARVLEVRVQAGARVAKGDPLAALDDRDLRARREQAAAGLTSAEAQAASADADLARFRDLAAKDAVSPRDLEAVTARARSARASVDQARDALREAEALLGEALVLAPFDGTIAEKRVDVGDVAVPGRPLFAIHDATRLQLEAQVPESCARGATLGMVVSVRIEPLEDPVQAVVDEVAPAADPASRTFVVKAALPASLGAARPGMFGRFLQPCGAHEALLVPEGAVTRWGQIESVTLRDPAGGPPRARHVKTGTRQAGGLVEVLSGLAAGDQVLIPEPLR